MCETVIISFDVYIDIYKRDKFFAKSIAKSFPVYKKDLMRSYFFLKFYIQMLSLKKL